MTPVMSSALPAATWPDPPTKILAVHVMVR
jgi:hypothetical protein